MAAGTHVTAEGRVCVCVTGQNWPLAPALAQCGKLSHDLTSLWESCVEGLKREVGGRGKGFSDLGWNYKTLLQITSCYSQDRVGFAKVEIRLRAHRQTNSSQILLGLDFGG